MKNVFLFPGQGVQSIGMGQDFYKEYQSVKDLFTLCSEITGKDILHLLFESDESELQKTDNTQIAMTLINLAVVRVLQERGIEPSLVAGFSLGEYASLVVSGIVKLEDVFDLVVIRGKIMDEAKKAIEETYNQEGSVGMSAVLGLNPKDIQNYLDEWNISHVYLSMYNSPVQGVLGGTEKGRSEAGEKLKEVGAKRIVPLKVAGPFHTPLMDGARANFQEAIKTINFADPSIPVFSNVHGKQVHSGEEMKVLCVEQLIKPVRWTEEESNIWAHAPSHIFEVGVGNVLSGLWKAWKKNQKEHEHIPDCKITGTNEAISNLEV